MAKKSYKALAPITLDKDYRPGDTIEAEPSEVEGKDVLELSGSSTSNTPTAPTDEAERIAAIVAAIGQLDKADTALWTNAGIPKTDGLTAITGWPVAAKERDVAWVQISAAK